MRVCRTCQGSRNLWKGTFVCNGKNPNILKNTVIRGGDELYLRKIRKGIKYKRTTQMAIVSAGSKPRNISINQSNLNSKTYQFTNEEVPQDIRVQYNLIRVFNSKNYT